MARLTLWLLGALVIWVVVRELVMARPEAPAAAAAELHPELRSRLDRLEQQQRQLLQRLQSLPRGSSSDGLDRLERQNAQLLEKLDKMPKPPTLAPPPTEKIQTDLVVLPEMVEYLKSLPPIPKKVHYIWATKNLTELAQYEMIQMGVMKMKALNPDWEVTIHDFDDIDKRLRETKLLRPEAYEVLRHAHIVERTDLFRLALIYEVGGLYVDIDRTVNIPLSERIFPGTRYIAPTYGNINAAQDLFGSAPGNKVIKDIIDLREEMRLTGNNGKPYERYEGWMHPDDILKMTQAFSNAVTKSLFGKVIPPGDGIIEARAAMKKTHPLIVTYQDEWCDGFLVRDFPGCKAVSRGSLYNAYNVGTWADKVRAKWAEKKAK